MPHHSSNRMMSRHGHYHIMITVTSLVHMCQQCRGQYRICEHYCTCEQCRLPFYVPPEVFDCAQFKIVVRFAM